MNRWLLIIASLIALGVTGCSTVLDAVAPNPPPQATVAPTLPAPATLPPAPTIPLAASPTTAAAATSKPQAAPTTNASPLDALTRAFRGWGGVKSLRAKITTTGPGAQDMTMEMVMPDRFHMVGSQFEAIMIGQTFYMKVGAQWQKMVLPKTFDLSFVDVKKYETELGASTETKLIGPDVLNGTPTLVYQYTTTIKTPTPTTHTSKVWIGVADNLPRKVESESKTGVKTVVLFSDYNTNISIEPPIK